jgi:hypothetical protein
MNYGNTPVFAVMEVPEGPALDAEVLSGKWIRLINLDIRVRNTNIRLTS